MNTSFTSFSSPVNFQVSGKYINKKVLLNSKNNPVEEKVNFNPYIKLLNTPINKTPQVKKLSIIHLIISILIWLFIPVFITGSLGVFILNTCINWVSYQVTLYREMEELSERVRVDSFVDSVNEMFNDIGYIKQIN